MEENVGGLDRVLRLVFGPALLAVGVGDLAGFLELDLLTTAIALIFGLVFLLTGISQKSVLNEKMGVNTKRR